MLELIPEYKEEQIIERLRKWNYQKVSWRAISETFKVSKLKAKRIEKKLNSKEKEGDWIVICKRCKNPFFCKKDSPEYLERLCPNCLMKNESPIEMKDLKVLLC